ncbi:Ig domain-containing protein [Variovorax sp. J22R133]|uniref:Ig domain-containing protein n=1 Tax=Variovorax brevis TaxID=3053503 RepID=UPI0025760518|nr:Ig domain-containing protein [Variovorax sp. J22R133]MDM0110996.1 Ig domain-containing protein [Variovorax sp. J22R133]
MAGSVVGVMKNWMARVTRCGLGAALCASLVACGGGGGGGVGDDETLYPTFTYAGQSAYVLHPTVVQPRISGLKNHSPRCALVGGRLPAGMTLNRDCTLSGTPTEIGAFSFNVELGASGVKNELVFGQGIAVFGPSVIYSAPASVNFGEEVDFRPLNAIFWVAQPGDSVTYAIAEGALPTGLGIDAATGRIHGTAATQGSYSFKVSATVTNSAGTARVVQDYPTQMSVGGLALSYGSYGGVSAWLGLPVSVVPTGARPSGLSYAWAAGETPPAGLQIDATTGTLSGVPSAPVNDAYRIAATGQVNGHAVQGFAYVSVYARSPITLAYAYCPGFVGEPFQCAPTIDNMSGQALTGATYSYTLKEGALPAGFVLDASTGVISGTPTATFSSPGNVYGLTVGINGVSFDLEAQQNLLAIY